ncbi:MAG: 30S ribosomal protein S20 [Candidatus Omnitrophica bacterium]|nr:30S ribosomal protein S20 [Candidatus Omnitrophota bacterium]
MPQRKSAKEELKKSLKRKQQNTIRKRALKEAIKAYKQALAADDLKTSQSALRTLYAALDKASARHIIHRRKADRKKSRFAALLVKKAPKTATKKKSS